MVEISLAETCEEANTAIVWLKERLGQLEARELASISGVAGSVEATMKTFELPNGLKIEVWDDNYTALSLRGPTELIGPIAAAYRQEQEDD